MNAVVGQTVYVSGAPSGTSAQRVVKINEYNRGSQGPGFQAHSVDDERDVGKGDSGGPVYRLQSDGEYIPVGMVSGRGWKVNSNPREMASWGACTQGVLNIYGQARECAVRMFHVNAKTIENRLGVSIYKP